MPSNFTSALGRMQRISRGGGRGRHPIRLELHLHPEKWARVVHAPQKLVAQPAARKGGGGYDFVTEGEPHLPLFDSPVGFDGCRLLKDREGEDSQCSPAA
jgi:hypothetical protein